MMPGKPQATKSQPTADDTRNPRKRQTRLDDNGEPVSLPVSKKRKSVADENRPKKKVPAQARPEKKKAASKKVSVPTAKKEIICRKRR